MFDTVVIEGLKLKTPKELASYLSANNTTLPTEFQTKDLDNALRVFRINEKGQIYSDEQKSTGKMIEYKSPVFDFHQHRSLIEELYWKWKYRKSGWTNLREERLVAETKTVKVKTNLTNTFSIYTYEEIGGRYVDIEYQIVALNGKVQKASLIKWSIEKETDAKKRHTENLEMNKKFTQQIEARNQFRSKWFYPFIREIYNPSVFFLRILVQSICNKIVQWSYRWHGL